MAVRSKALYFRPTQSTKVTSISTPQQAGTHRQEFVQSLGKGGKVPQQCWRSTTWFPTAQMQRNSRWASVADLGRMSILETYRRRQGRDRLIAASLPAPFIFGQTLPLSGLDGWAVGMQPRHLGRRATSCGCWGFRCLGWTLVSSTAFLDFLDAFLQPGKKRHWYGSRCGLFPTTDEKYRLHCPMSESCARDVARNLYSAPIREMEDGKDNIFPAASDEEM